MLRARGSTCWACRHTIHYLLQVGKALGQRAGGRPQGAAIVKSVAAKDTPVQVGADATRLLVGTQHGRLMHA